MTERNYYKLINNYIFAGEFFAVICRPLSQKVGESILHHM